jgi:hypothetical protein
MPISHVGRGESPKDAITIEARLDLRILGNVFIVVEVEKIMVPHLPEDRECQQNQRQIDQNGQVCLGRSSP